MQRPGTVGRPVIRDLPIRKLRRATHPGSCHHRRLCRYVHRESPTCHVAASQSKASLYFLRKSPLPVRGELLAR